MTKALLTDGRHVLQLPFLCVIFILSSFPAARSVAQEDEIFDPIAVGAQLDELSEQLGAEGVAEEFLTQARTTIVVIDAEAAACRLESTQERERLEARYEPLEDISDDVAPAVFDQRIEIRQLLDSAIDRQTRCTSVKDYTEALLTRITETQNLLSQQFLSNRGRSVIVLLQELPDRAKTWPAVAATVTGLRLGTRLSWWSIPW